MKNKEIDARVESFTTQQKDNAASSASAELSDFAICAISDSDYFAPAYEECLSNLEYDQNNASIILSASQKIILTISGLIICYYVANSNKCFITLLYFIVNTLYLFLSIFKLKLCMYGHKMTRTGLKFENIHYRHQKNLKKDYFTKNLSTYSILLPVYKEKRHVLEKLLNNIQNLEYPKTKLQVLLVLESHDQETLDAVRAINLPFFIQILIAPPGSPQTKARACNYALSKVRGKYLAIYDAEDLPDPNQLLLTSKLFKSYFQTTGKSLACIQAKLNYYNSQENFLTQMFAIEYALLFEYILPALSSQKMPIPLGGSSNHFDVSILKRMNGWDIYNVTEDADIGVRFAMNNYKVVMINSYTMEEAPITLLAWIYQRRRWIKGHIQTYLVCMRHPIQFIKLLGWQPFVCISFMLGLAPITMIAASFMFMSMIFNFCRQYRIDVYYDIILYILMILNLFIGFVFGIAQARVVVKRFKFLSKIQIWALFPLYFFLHTVASFLALYDLCINPFYWQKTTHGVSKYF